MPVARVALLSLHSSPIAPLGRSDAGGMNLYVRRLATELGDRGVMVDMFTRRTDPNLPEELRLGRNVRLIHLDAGSPQPLPKCRLPVLVPALTSRFLAFAARQDIEYDVLHCHYWLSGLVGIRARDSMRAPVISMFHTLSRVKAHYGRDSVMDSPLRFDGECTVLEESDAIVGATRMERQQLQRLYGQAPARFSVIPPGVDATLFRPHPEDASRRKLGIQGLRVILFVGRLDPMKGLDTLFRAVSLLPRERREGLRVVVVGGNDDGDRIAAEQYRRLAASLGIQNIVDMRSNVAQDDLPLYYSAATVCAVPSMYESFGMVATESMSCETPVVAFNVGGLATTIRQGDTGFLAQAGSEVDFARMLGAALDEGGLDAMGRRARASIARYEWRAIAAKTLRLYEAVAAAYEYQRHELDEVS